MAETILSIKDLAVEYRVGKSVVKAVNGLDITLEAGESLGLVGETGAGKTTTALSIMGLIPNPPGKITRGEIIYEGTDLLKVSEKEMRHIRGNKISMIFQDPMTSLDPVMTVGEQIARTVKLHHKVSPKEALARAQEMLELVGIPGSRHVEYPHQFSGGMKQRVVIAIALSCNPSLLIADEPTTALDVTIQAQVLEMIAELKKNFNTSLILITHDLGVVAEVCEKAAIIYAGEIVEYGELDYIYNKTMHPYTMGLFGSIPSLDENVERLRPIQGLMPDPANLPVGCVFAERCPYAEEACTVGPIPVYEPQPGHLVKCLRAKEGAV